MRTGASFARGSCRALKWMLVLGALSVLGSAQAAAQTAPTIEMAEYDRANPRIITVTTSVPVYLDEGTLQALAADFTLSGGTIAESQSQGPLQVFNLPLTSVPGSRTFHLRFASTIASLRGTGSTGLSLTYTARPGRTILRSGTTTTPMANTDTPIPVTGPDDTGLTLQIPAATKAALQKIRQVGTSFEAIELPAATGATEAVTYDVRGLPPGLVFEENATATNFALHVGVEGATAGELATNAEGDAVGNLPDNIGNYPVVYTATMGTESDEDSFMIRLANIPEAVTNMQVVAAGPSSLTVAWRRPLANNARITSYEVRYKAAGAADDEWLDALIPDALGNAVATTSHTITGLAPGTYDVQVRAVNEIGPSGWAEGRGETGAAPGKPALTLDVDSELDEGRNQIPVTVTATVPPSAQATRTLKVTLWISSRPGVLAEDAAELPNTAGIVPDVTWANPGVQPPNDSNNRGRVLTLDFNSNLSSEATAYLNTMGDADAEDERFRILARAITQVGDDFATTDWALQNVVIEDDEVQEYKLQIDDVALESNGMFDEGHGDDPVEMTLIVSPARTLPKSFFVNLKSAQNASAYSLSSGGTNSGGPTAVSLRIDMPAGDDEAEITLTAASNDGDRKDDTITLQIFETSATSPTTAGDMVGDAVMLNVVDQHKLPKVTMGSIMVDGAAVTSLKEGETGTVTLMADRGTPTDDTPDGEKITVALKHGAASSASAADYSLSPETVTISGTSGTFMLEVLADDEIDAEELVLQAEVTGVAMYGDMPDMVDLGLISFMDGTTKLVYPKTEEEIQAVIYPAKEAGMGDDMMFNPGETIEIANPGSLFNQADGVTLSFTAESDMEDVATVSVSGSGMVSVTAQDMAGVMAHITITAHASMAASGAKGLPQTDPSEASVIFPVEVGLEALSFTLTGPEDMNVAEGMSAMVTATANRAVTADVTINLMRDRAASTAGEDDYMAEAITIEAGMMSGTTMVMAVEDNMAEEMEELALYGMAADNAGEVTGEVKLYLWDAAVPALPLIAQLLLGLFLGIGGFRRYLRR